MDLCKKIIPPAKVLEDRLEDFVSWAKSQTCPVKGPLWTDDAARCHEKHLAHVQAGLYSGQCHWAAWKEYT